MLFETLLFRLHHMAGRHSKGSPRELIGLFKEAAFLVRKFSFFYGRRGFILNTLKGNQLYRAPPELPGIASLVEYINRKFRI